jgi:hypothetical protein
MAIVGPENQFKQVFSSLSLEVYSAFGDATLFLSGTMPMLPCISSDFRGFFAT